MTARENDEEVSPEDAVGSEQVKQQAHFEEGEEPPPPGVFAMSVVRWLLVLAMAIAAGASLFYVFGDRGSALGSAGDTQYHCPMHPSVVQDHPGECPICSMTLVRFETTAAPSTSAAPSTTSPTKGEHTGHRHVPSDPYLCPMHPEETGTSASAMCPICGMRLEPKPPEAGASPSGSVEHELVAPATPKGLAPIDLSLERIQLVGMRTARVVRGMLPSELRVLGFIAAPEGGIASVQTLFSGWIEELHVSETGQPVVRGQLLARIYSPELLAAQQELLNAKRWEGAQEAPNTLLEDTRRRLALMGMQSAEIAEVERAGAPHRLIEVRSPARGYIASKSAVSGLYVQPGTQLFQIADLSRVWAMLDVFERDVGRIRVGQSATLTLTAYPGEAFRGRVDLIYPVLSGETRTLRARVELNNPQLKLKPGMFGEVAIDVAAGEGLLISREALVDTGEQQYVFVAQDAGHFEPRVVRVGARAGDSVAILSGLSEGELVVETGNFLLDSESRLRAAIQGPKASAGAASAPSACDALFDRPRFADKYEQCRACEAQHRGMGSMEEDCRNAIPKPWR